MLNLTARRFFTKRVRPFEERMRLVLDQHKEKRLKLARFTDRPVQFALPKEPPAPKVVKGDPKMLPLSKANPPYQNYLKEEIDAFEKYETYYDPLFNPHLHEERHRVDPSEEPFDAIYADSKSEAATEYTRVRNITTPQLWEYVERLARITVPPLPKRRKPNEPVQVLPSGYVPPPETPPDLPYFVARTRNHLLPVYYMLHDDEEKCCTTLKQVTGDIWKLEEELRTHLESLNGNKKILSSVQETDARILFRGRYLHQIVDWLIKQGF